MNHFYPNGVRLLVKESHSAPVAAVQIWVGFGSADEPSEHAGVAHVMEHMLFKGTKNRAPGEMAHQVEAAGGHINAWTSFDETAYHLVLPKEKLSLAVDILADAVRNPTFDQHELDSELQVILEELDGGKDDPGHMCIENIFKKAFKGHPYSRPIIGYRKTVEGMTSRKLKQLHKRFYTAGDLTVVIAGDVDAKRCKSLVKRKLGSLPKRKKRQRKLAPPKQKSLRTALTTVKDIQEAHIAFGFHIPGIQHEDTAALDLLAIILGQGESSRLHTRLKKERMLVSDVYAHAYTPKELGLFVVGASVPQDRFKEAVEALVEEVFTVTREEVSGDELNKAARMAMADMVYGGETAQGLARKIGYYGVNTGDPDYEKEYLAQVRMTTPSDLLAAALAHLKPSKLTVSLASPKTPAKGASKELGGTAKRRRAWIKETVKACAREKRPTTTSAPIKKGPAGVYKQELQCGATALVLPDPAVASVAFRTVWLGGLRAEKKKTNGVSNLFAGMLSRGSRRYPGTRGVEVIESLGGSMSGVAGRNTIGLRAEMLSASWPKSLEVIADTLSNPSLDKADLEKERIGTLHEHQAQEDHPTFGAFRAFREALFGSHPYSLSLLGQKESVASISEGQLATYKRRFLRPQDLVVSLVGDVDPQRAVELLDAQLMETQFTEASSSKRGALTRKTPRRPRKPKLVTAYKDRKQAHIVLGYLGLTIEDPRRFPLEVLIAALAGQGGRLFRELRDKRGMAYRVSASNVEGLDPGYISVYMATAPYKVEDAVKGIREELQKVCDKRLSARELNEIKNHLAGSQAISLQRRAVVAANMALNELYGLGYDEHTRYRERVLAVTADEVRAVAQELLNPSQEVLAIVSPKAPRG